MLVTLRPKNILMKNEILQILHELYKFSRRSFLRYISLASQELKHIRLVSNIKKTDVHYRKDDTCQIRKTTLAEP